MPLAADPVRQFTLVGDHGVVAEGAMLYPQEVTRQMAGNFLAANGAACAIYNDMAAFSGAGIAGR